MGDVRLMLVMGWDRNLISAFNLCFGWAARCLEDCHVGRMASRPLSVVLAKMLAMELEFKASHCFLTP